MKATVKDGGEMAPGSRLKGKSDTLVILRFLLYVERVEGTHQTQTDRCVGYFVN